MNELPDIPAPEGWNRRWPFAAEVAFWLIPKKERAAALALELVRERGVFVGSPWLTLTDEIDKRHIDGMVGTPQSFATLEPARDAVTVANMAVFHHMLIAAPTDELEGLRDYIDEILSRRADGRNPPWPELDDQNARKAPFATPNLFAVRIDPRASRKAAMEAFGQLLDREGVSLQPPLHGKGAFDVDAGLAALALRRLRAAHPLSEYWRPLAETDLRPWAGNAPAARVREICLEKIRHLERKNGLPES